MDYTLADLTKAVSMFKNVEKKEEYIISFTKEDDGLWYVVYPDWPFDYSHLQMVDGADKLCELLSYDGKHTKVSVIPSNEIRAMQTSDINDRFMLMRFQWGLAEGATYQVKLYQTKTTIPEIWLCPVTLFVLGEYPLYLYVKKLA